MSNRELGTWVEVLQHFSSSTVGSIGKIIFKDHLVKAWVLEASYSTRIKYIKVFFKYFSELIHRAEEFFCSVDR